MIDVHTLQVAVQLFSLPLASPAHALGDPSLITAAYRHCLFEFFRA